MTPVILSAAQARELPKREVAHCECPLWTNCECGKEADLIRLAFVTTAGAGWVAT